MSTGAMPASAVPAGTTPDGATPPAESPELAAARRAREAQAARVAAGTSLPPLPPPAIRDPLAYCVWATVALLAWLLSPPLVAACFGGAGLWAYARAWRAGLRRSDCILRDPRLVMLYLGLLAAAGLVVFVAGWLAPARAGAPWGVVGQLLHGLMARR